MNLIRYLGGVTFIFVFNSLSIVNAEGITDLQSFAWQNRIILLNSVDDKTLDTIRSKEHKDDLGDRYLLWFAVNEGRVSSNYKGVIAKTFGDSLINSYPLDKNRVLLLGYDGFIKLKSQQLDLPLIFKTIDGMPMRQIEMQRQKGIKE